MDHLLAQSNLLNEPARCSGLGVTNSVHENLYALRLRMHLSVPSSHGTFQSPESVTQCTSLTCLVSDLIILFCTVLFLTTICSFFCFVGCPVTMITLNYVVVDSDRRCNAWMYSQGNATCPRDTGILLFHCIGCWTVILIVVCKPIDPCNHGHLGKYEFQKLFPQPETGK